jgi:hypothetical protein
MVRDVPRRNLQSSRAVSSSAFNISEKNYGIPEPSHPIHQDVRRRNHNRSQSQQPGRPVGPVDRHSGKHVDPAGRPRSSVQQYNIRALHTSSSYFPGPQEEYSAPPSRSIQEFSGPPSRSNQGGNINSNSKHCLNEFQFKRMNRASADPFNIDEKTFIEKMINREFLADTGSQESGIFSTGSSQESPRKAGRKPGLGRRAITQAVNGTLSDEGGFRGDLEGLEGAWGPEEGGDMKALKKGLLWQQRDKIFSRWKERYFILTKDFLQCFKKESSKISEMGGFIFKIKLSEIESVELLDKRGYLTVSINLVRESKVFLRRTEGIRDWFQALRESIKDSKTRKCNRSSAIFLDRKQTTDSAGMESWAEQRRMKFGRSDSTPDVHKAGEKERITLDELSSLYKREEEEERRKEQEKIRNRKNRLSLLPDVELHDLSSLGCPAGELSLEKSFLNRKPDTDSGNNSLNTNRSNTSTGSSKVSGPTESSFLEEEEEEGEDGDDGEHLQERRMKEGESVTISCSNPSPQIKISKPQTNKNVIEVRYRERSRDGQWSKSPRSNGQESSRQTHQTHVNRLQITHV